MINNADVLRLRNRVSTVNAQVAAFYQSLSGADPSPAQAQAVAERVTVLIGQLSEVLRIIEMGERQARDVDELASYRA